MPEAGPTADAPHRRLWRALALLLCALFLASVARFYHPGLGFTALILFPAGHEYELPALQKLPHYQYGINEGYDGVYYAQLAMVPLLRDAAIDRTLDAPAYRARRILFCWTAYLLGLGRPAWILQAYALQNVACWLLLAWVITRWIPPDTGRLFALWAGAMFSHGLLTSVRLSLLDGPSLLLLTLAAAAAERRHTWLTSAVVGIAGLGRETNLLGAVLLPQPRGWRGWLRLTGAGILILLPLLVWQDYVWSIYRGTSVSSGANQITVPFTAYIRKWALTYAAVKIHGFGTYAGTTLLTIIALTAQAVFVAWMRAYKDPWWRLAAAYVALMFVVHGVVWEGYPGAVTRVVLPLTVGFNILLARRPPGFWVWFVFGNLHLVAAARVLL